LPTPHLSMKDPFVSFPFFYISPTFRCPSFLLFLFLGDIHRGLVPVKSTTPLFPIASILSIGPRAPGERTPFPSVNVSSPDYVPFPPLQHHLILLMVFSQPHKRNSGNHRPLETMLYSERVQHLPTAAPPLSLLKLIRTHRTVLLALWRPRTRFSSDRNGGSSLPFVPTMLSYNSLVFPQQLVLEIFRERLFPHFPPFSFLGSPRLCQYPS